MQGERGAVFPQLHQQQDFTSRELSQRELECAGWRGMNPVSHPGRHLDSRSGKGDSPEEAGGQLPEHGEVEEGNALLSPADGRGRSVGQKAPWEAAALTGPESPGKPTGKDWKEGEAGESSSGEAKGRGGLRRE